MPGWQFRRLLGQFDPVVNDGSLITDPSNVIVPARDALFLVKLPMSSVNDTDGDGLLDAWELKYAPNLSALGVSGVPNSAKDSDGDGCTDAAEQADGTNPLDPSSRLAMESLGWSGEGLKLRLQTVPGRCYRVFFSPDLSTWSPFGSALEATTDRMDITIPYSLVGDLPRGFFRAASQ